MFPPPRCGCLPESGCTPLLSVGQYLSVWTHDDSEPRKIAMKALQPKDSAAERKPGRKKAVSTFFRMLAWAYDFLLALFVVSWVIWDALVLDCLFGCSSGAWTDYQVARSEALCKFGRQRALSEWQTDLLSCLPELLECIVLVALSLLLVRWFRRFVRTTPGEWTFSVRRDPSPPPAGGFPRRVCRAVAGLAAFIAVVILWTLLEMYVLDPI